MIFEHAARSPEGRAVDDGSRQRSWAELADRATRMARFLREDAGVAPGEHAAILMENRVEYLEVTLGAILAGVWLTPLNWHLTESEPRGIVSDPGSRLLGSDARFGEAARRVGAPTGVSAGEELEGCLAAARDEPLPLDGPAGGTMIYTSGTTGRPKGVKRTRPADLGAALELQLDER